MKAIYTLFSTLTLTLVLEVPLGAWIMRRKDSIIPLILINLLTNPALNAALMIIFTLTQNYAVYLIVVIIGEIAVFLGEGLLIGFLCDLPPKKSIIISTTINAASLILGSAILSLI